MQAISYHLVHGRSDIREDLVCGKIIPIYFFIGGQIDMISQETINSCCRLTMVFAVGIGIWLMALGGMTALPTGTAVERVYQPTGLLTVHQDITGRVQTVIRNHIPI